MDNLYSSCYTLDWVEIYKFKKIDIKKRMSVFSDMCFTVNLRERDKHYRKGDFLLSLK